MDYIDIYSTLLVGMIAFILETVINIVVFFLVIKLIINAIKKVSNRKYFKSSIIVNDISKPIKERYTDISKAELATFNTDDLTAFKNYFYRIFLNFETAYNNLDYNAMKTLSTKQLFQNYYTGITLDLESGKKRIISNIQKNNVIIFEVFSSSVKQVVSAIIEISYINYTVDKNGYIISGSRDKVTESFEVIFKKEFGNENKEITNCPNCGAAINGLKCEFCRSTIKNPEFKINSIRKIIDK